MMRVKTMSIAPTIKALIEFPERLRDTAEHIESLGGRHHIMAGLEIREAATAVERAGFLLMGELTIEGALDDTVWVEVSTFSAKGARYQEEFSSDGRWRHRERLSETGLDPRPWIPGEAPEVD